LSHVVNPNAVRTSIDDLEEELRTSKLSRKEIRQNEKALAFARYCRRQGIPIETRKDGLDFTNSTPKARTYHSAKGLTFDSVLLPRLVRSSFPAALDGRTLRLLYVGITRATRWVYFSAVRNNALEALERIRALSRLEPPVVTFGVPPAPVRRAEQASEPDDVLDIL
jgi:superfamily I DNA/RNA helicase